MGSRGRYEEVPQVDSPPAYVLQASTSSPETTAADDVKPPDYEVQNMDPAVLPTYEQVQTAKMATLNHGLESPPAPQHPSSASLTGGDGPLTLGGQQDGQLPIPLGSDSIFIACFLFAFLFNWMGLIAVFCLSYTMAARCGSISGFGLSIVKWATILKNSSYKSEHDEWIWWLFIVMGFVIFMRGCLNYLAYKNQCRIHGDDPIVIVTNE